MEDLAPGFDKLTTNAVDSAVKSAQCEKLEDRADESIQLKRIKEQKDPKPKSIKTMKAGLDQGIHRTVPPGLWLELVAKLVEGVAAGEAGCALERTVRRCGEILDEHRVERRPDDLDELDDRPRVREH